jgi:hypothetical protein
MNNSFKEFRKKKERKKERKSRNMKLWEDTKIFAVESEIHNSFFTIVTTSNNITHFECGTIRFMHDIGIETAKVASVTIQKMPKNIGTHIGWISEWCSCTDWTYLSINKGDFVILSSQNL